MGAEELLVSPVLLRDRGAMADLVRTVLGPLTRARGGAEPLLRTLAECAASGYVNAEAARRLGISVRTLPYRSERVRTLTGYSPAEPLQCFTLEAAVMGRVECERARRTAGTDGGGRGRTVRAERAAARAPKRRARAAVVRPGWPVPVCGPNQPTRSFWPGTIVSASCPMTDLLAAYSFCQLVPCFAAMPARVSPCRTV